MSWHKLAFFHSENFGKSLAIYASCRQQARIAFIQSHVSEHPTNALIFILLLFPTNS